MRRIFTILGGVVLLSCFLTTNSMAQGLINFNFDCSDRLEVEVTGKGINGQATGSIIPVAAGATDSILVQLVAKGIEANLPTSVTFTNADGTEVEVGPKVDAEEPNNRPQSAATYSAFFNRTPSISYSINGGNPSAIYSIVAYSIIPTVDPCEGGGAELIPVYLFLAEKEYTVDIGTSANPRDVNVVLPVSELDSDSRVIEITVSEDANPGNSQFFTTNQPGPGTKSYLQVNMQLTDVPGDSQFINVKLESPNPGGDSFVMGSVLVAGSCDFVCERTLPVEWGYFDAAMSIEGDVGLNWGTITETDNSHFLVQRSYTGINDFMDVGTIEGAGNTEIPQDYTFSDVPDANFETVYYRLKQVDLNGGFDYSDIRTVNVEIDRSKLYVFPNPANDFVTVMAPNVEGNASIDIWSTAGQRIQSLEFTRTSSGNFLVNTSNLSNGIYVMTIESNSKTMSTKLIVNH